MIIVKLIGILYNISKYTNFNYNTYNVLKVKAYISYIFIIPILLLFYKIYTNIIYYLVLGVYNF